MNDLHDLMDRALSNLDVPTDRLHEGAVRRGRTARRRRRAGVTLGGVAVAAAVTALVVPTMTGSGSTEGSVAHESDHRDTTGPAYEPPPGWWDLPGGKMRAHLERLLPKGLTVTDANLGNDDLAPGEKLHGGWLEVDVADAEGPAGGLNVLLYAPQPDTADGRAFTRDRTTCPGDLVAPDECTEQYDDAGEPVGRTSRTVSGGVVVLEVTRLTPDGALVYAAASNSSDDKWGRGSSTDGDRLPVSLAVLRAIADSPTWRE